VISLELAKKLKEAGLEWEPQRGDWYYFGDDGELHLLRVATPRPVPEVVYSAPRLDQLLAEIYKTYNFTLHSSGYIVLRKKGSGMVAEHFHSDTLENAAAEALLWIYERRNQHES
jgi:hypothetical protein